jgi:hypothetical protein
MPATPDLDVDYVASTPGAIAWLHPGAITFDEQGEMQLIGSTEVFNHPNKQTCTVFELSNDNGSLNLNLSILSNDGLWEILQKNDAKFREALQGIRIMLDSKVNPHQNNNSEGEFEEEYNSSNHYIQNITYEFTTVFTKNLINQLYNIKSNEANASNIVDDMLAGIFGGGKVKIEYDADHDFKEFSEDDAKTESSGIELVDMEPTPEEPEEDEFKEYDPDDTKEKGGFTIKDFIDDISKNTGAEVKEIEASPMDDKLNMLSRHFVDIYKILNINNPSECLKTENALSNMLDEIFELDYTDHLVDTERFIIDTICNCIVSDKDEIACDLLDFHNTLQLEVDYIESVVDVNDTSESSKNFQKMYRVKYNLNNDFKSNFAVYSKLIETIMYNRNVFEDSDKTKMFCIVIMLAHLINKNVLKNMRDIEKKQALYPNSDTKLDQYENKIIAIGKDFLTKFRNELNNAIG